MVGMNLWAFDNNAYSVTINGMKYLFSYCDSEGKKGYRIKMNETSSCYVISESFNYQDYMTPILNKSQIYSIYDFLIDTQAMTFKNGA